MSSLQVAIACDCGKEIIANQGNAGTEVDCECGASTTIPRLSKIRELAGESAYATNSVDRLRVAISNGSLLTDEKCCFCSSLIGTRYSCTIVCEESYVHRAPETRSLNIGGIAIAAMMKMFLPFWILFSKKESTEHAEVRGNDVMIDFPVLICEACERIEGSPQRTSTARKAIRSMPECEELLSGYPKAKIKFEK